MPFKVLSSRLPNFQLLYQRLQVSLDPLLSTSPVQIAWIAQSISNCTGYLCLSRWTEPFLSRVSCSPIWLRTNAENAPLIKISQKWTCAWKLSFPSNAPREICYKPRKHSKCCVHSDWFSPFNATVQPHWLLHLQVSSAYRPKQLGGCTYLSCSQNAVMCSVACLWLPALLQYHAQPAHSQGTSPCFPLELLRCQVVLAAQELSGFSGVSATDMTEASQHPVPASAVTLACTRGRLAEEPPLCCFSLLCKHKMLLQPSVKRALASTWSTCLYATMKETKNFKTS